MKKRLANFSQDPTGEISAMRVMDIAVVGAVLALLVIAKCGEHLLQARGLLTCR